MEFPKASITADEILRKNSNFRKVKVQRSIINECIESKSSNTLKYILSRFPIAFYKVLSHRYIGFSNVLSRSPIGIFQSTES